MRAEVIITKIDDNAFRITGVRNTMIFHFRGEEMRLGKILIKTDVQAMINSAHISDDFDVEIFLPSHLDSGKI